MRAAELIATLAFAAQAYAHGYVYRVTADNTVYPGWDIYVDRTINPTPKRIAYGGSDANPITATNVSDLACNKVHTPVPGAIAEVRAGSNITFHWSPWLHSHKGPITAWLAPYSGDVAAVNVNQLDFFKFAEATTDASGNWWNDEFMDRNNNSWTVNVPADIKAGTYVLRHEIIALHFAVNLTPGFFGLGPQFYPVCFNFKVTGDGTATPPGVKFPGAYSAEDPAFKIDVTKNLTAPFPSLGGAVYKSSRSVSLTPKSRTVISPTNNGTESDDAYFKLQASVVAAQGQVTAYFDSIGG